MSRFHTPLLLLLILCTGAIGAPWLHVSDNQRRLERSDGTTFFYMGDTAWELFHRLDREEADLYLTNRAEKGFTVIQAVAIAERDGVNTPNAYGHLPLLNQDPEKPDVKPGPQNDYWDHVDYIVNKAGSLGLAIGLLPSWGDHWQGTRGGSSPVIFNEKNARVYGKWLGNRYRDKPVIWILGGDRNIYSKEDREVVTSLARGLREGDGGNNLITFHPRGPGLSSDSFHDSDWPDFNMIHSSHAARDHDNGLYVEHDYALKPPKPTLDGEPRYEGLRAGFYLTDAPRNIYFDDYDARQAAWWAVMAGACGHTYGNGNIWQMYDTGRESVLGANVPWHEAIDHPGAFQMGHLRRLMDAMDFGQLLPNQDFIREGPTYFGSKVRGLLAEDGSQAVIYSPRGDPFMVDLSVFKGKEAQQVVQTWFDPRYGVRHYIHRGDPVGIQTYTPPTHGRGQDWVLLLEMEEER
ncbi:MAG: DUF4038 domain-containing protein [Verrucomicrobiae bacterium]|nr:DUF4038 domain-containing protein [Verrucomicrobiae bacterium]